MSSVPQRQPAVGFIFVTLMLSIMGFGLLMPVLPKLIVEFRGGNMTSGTHTYGAIFSIYAVMQFVGSPILGALSDRFGRRRIILIATAGSAIDYVIMACAPSLTWFFVARIIAGFTAGVYATANAYVADVTPPEKRAGAFGLLGAAFGIGFVLGPALGGFLGAIDLRLPFWAAAGCSAANWFWGLLVLPESLRPENRRAFSWKRANPVGALLAIRRLPSVLGLVETYFIFALAQSMMFSLWALYTSYRYHWSTTMVGASLTLAGILSVVFQGFLVKHIVPRLGEPRAALAGLGAAAACNIAYGLATETWMVFVIIVCGCLGGLTGPALQTYISKHVPPDEQGTAQGVLGGLQSLAAIPGSLLGTWALGWAIDPNGPIYLPGLPLFIAAAFLFVAALLATRSFRRDAAKG